MIQLVMHSSICIGLVKNLNLLFNLLTFFGLSCVCKILATQEKKRKNSKRSLIYKRIYSKSSSSSLLLGRLNDFITSMNT